MTDKAGTHGSRLATELLRVTTSPILWLLHVTGVCSKLLVKRGFEKSRWQLGRLGAWTRYQSALRTVPGYADFLAQHMQGDPASARALSSIPAMDKANYVQKYPLAARCVGGELPTRGLLIDESSGNSGQATNWVRGKAERAANGRISQRGLRYRLGDGPLFFINAFALGPWATGINLTLSLAAWSCVKTVGPDIARIERTLQQFGSEYHYVIMGYPPFLKQVVDKAAIDWTRYHVSMIYGGEGVSESMRRYVESRGIRRLFGAYGASDLELNIAAETGFTIALRRLLESRSDVAARVVQHAGAMPMIFQFNPADFFIESNAEGELLVTLCRPRYVAPKIRYNIHDVGHVVRMPELARTLAAAGVTLASLDPHALDLPLLFHYGRSDGSVAYFGCKISPADIQEALFRHPVLARVAGAFQLRTFDDETGDERLLLSLEVGVDDMPVDPGPWTDLLFDALAAVNHEFREARRMVPAGKGPALELFRTGTGPFTEADTRIKRVYVSRDNA